MTDQELAAHIQHTLIGVGISYEQITRHVQQCVEFGFNAAMVGADWVVEVKKLLDGTDIKVASAIDFPYGNMTTAGRVAEARALVDAGVDEIDIGVHISWLISGEKNRFEDDIAAVVQAAGVPIKVMLELPLLTDDQKLQAVEASVAAGVAYVKNASSGQVGKATAGEMAWLRAHVPANVKVKGSGGISTRAHVEELLAAGADLVGSSASVAILTGDSASSY